MQIDQKYLVLASAFGQFFMVWGCSTAMGIFTDPFRLRFALTNAQASVTISLTLTMLFMGGKQILIANLIFEITEVAEET